MTDQMPSPELLAHWADCYAPRLIPGQGLCLLRRFIYTTGLLTHVSLDETGCSYAARYCYAHIGDAFSALASWNGEGDPPGPWIKEKVSERLGPGTRQPDEEQSP